jgi:hypothetical protein
MILTGHSFVFYELDYYLIAAGFGDAILDYAFIDGMFKETG